MDGIATFLLGGAVGAVLGYLASRKRPQQTMTKMPGRPLEAPPVGPPAAAEEVAVEAPSAEEVAVEAPSVATAAEETPEATALEGMIAEEEEEVGPGRPTARVVEAPEGEEAGAEGLREEPPSEPPAESVGEPVAAVPVADIAVDNTLLGTEEEYVPWESAEAGVGLEEIGGEAAVLAEVDITEIGFVEVVELEAQAGPETAVGPEEAQTGSETAAEPAAPVEPEGAVISPIDDLKARIEETRRRIRRELERPFVSIDEVRQEGDWEMSSTVRAAEEVVEPEPVESGAVGPFAETAISDAGPGPGPGEVLDYESVKNRIEMTRSRLKAKAFDAMMTGESALLGREPEDAPPKRPVMPVIDSEIDQTIETGLREQEE